MLAINQKLAFNLGPKLDFPSLIQIWRSICPTSKGKINTIVRVVLINEDQMEIWLEQEK